MDTQRLRRSTGRTALAIAALAVLALGTIGLAACGSTTTTSEPATTTTVTIPGETVTINESANGTVVRLSPGYILIVDLEAQPSAGYTWNVLPPDADILKLLPGPQIKGGSLPGEPAMYSFSALALSVGKTEFKASYVGPTGSEDKQFSVTVEVQSSKPTTSTTQGPTTTGQSTSTTAKPTSTTAKPTTTTAKPTTTTAKPATTTTRPPTSTTTEPPTTTTEAPTTTTTQPFHPTTSTVLGVVYVDQSFDGNVVHLASTFRMNLTLRVNQSTGDVWRLTPIDETVLKLSGEPKIIPGGAAPGTPAWEVWSFEPVGEGQVQIEVDLVSQDGSIKDKFYCVVVVNMVGE